MTTTTMMIRTKIKHWANGFNLHDWCLVDIEVFLGKRESKTVLREPLGTLTTTTGKQCNKNRGKELANHLLKILANPTLGVLNRCKQYELQYINNEQQYLINRLQKQPLKNQKQHQQNFINRQQQHFNIQKQQQKRFNDRRQQHPNNRHILLQQQPLIYRHLHSLRQHLNNRHLQQHLQQRESFFVSENSAQENLGFINHNYNDNHSTSQHNNNTTKSCNNTASSSDNITMSPNYNTTSFYNKTTSPHYTTLEDFKLARARRTSVEWRLRNIEKNPGPQQGRDRRRYEKREQRRKEKNIKRLKIWQGKKLKISTWNVQRANLTGSNFGFITQKSIKEDKDLGLVTKIDARSEGLREYHHQKKDRFLVYSKKISVNEPRCLQHLEQAREKKVNH